MKKLSLFKKNTHHYTGFTLVEFIVIMSIFVIMIGVVLFNFTGFRSAVTMENLAQDIALSIRQIQVSAGATQSAINDPGKEIPRGIYFKKDDGRAGFSSTFYTFQDTNENGLMDDNEEIDAIVIQTPDIISNIYFTDSIKDSESITSQGIDSGNVGITFKRFDTAAIFTNEQGGRLDNSNYLVIEIKSPDPEKKPRYVVVSKIGQVSIQ